MIGAGRGVFEGGVIALVACLAVMMLWLYLRRRARWNSFVASLTGRFGIVEIRSGSLSLSLVLARPGWRGTLRASGRPRSAVEMAVFEGTTGAPRSGWSLTSRRLLPKAGPGVVVEPASGELRERFAVFAERPAELRGFLDAEVERLLVELDAGGAHALVGVLPGISVAVQGSDVHVSVMGQQGDDEEHLVRVLSLIERVLEHGG